MRRPRPKLFRGRHFRDDVIVLCVRWYLRYSLRYARAMTDLKKVGPRCRCPTAPYLNNIVEQDHRFIKKRIAPGLGFAP